MGEIASTGQLRTGFLRWALITVPATTLLGLLSGKLGNPAGSNNPWFEQLAKPAIMPPAWVFPAAWSTLYIMMAVALAMILNARGAKGRAIAVALFVFQLMLNLAWSPVFFSLHRIMFAFGLIVATLLWAAATTWLFWKIRPSAAMLMLPYLAWLLFAGLLNWQIHLLNPFGLTLVPTNGDTQIIIQ